MIIVQEQVEFPETSGTVVVHDPTPVMLKYVELCRHESRGSWSWLGCATLEGGRLTLEFSNRNAASVICKKLKRAAEMSVEFAQGQSDSHCKSMKLWSTIALLLSKPLERSTPEDPLRDYFARLIDNWAQEEDAKWMAMPSEPEPPLLYGLRRRGEWAKDGLGRTIFACDKTALVETWAELEGWDIQEVPPEMLYWLSVGINVVG